MTNRKEEPIEFDPEQLRFNPIREVQLQSSVLLKIMKHCRDHTVKGNGQLLGLEVNGSLQISNCYPVGTKFSEHDFIDEGDNTEYHLTMLRNLRKLNYEANSVGWYRSTFLGDHWDQSFIEEQFEYQKTLEHAIVLIYDPTQTYHGSVSLKAMRLTDQFMKLFTNKKFTMELLAQNELSAEDIFEYLPMKIRNSNLAHSLLYHLEELKSTGVNRIVEDVEFPAFDFKSNLPEEISVVSPSFEVLEQRSNYFLEKHFEYLGDTIDDWGQEQWRWHGWQRNLLKEQQRIAGVVFKRKQENEKRVAQGLEPTFSADELEMNSVHLQRLLKNEPSRLESLVLHNHMTTYCEQVETFSAASVAKMQGIRNLQETN